MNKKLIIGFALLIGVTVFFVMKAKDGYKVKKAVTTTERPLDSTGHEAPIGAPEAPPAPEESNPMMGSGRPLTEEEMKTINNNPPDPEDQAVFLGDNLERQKFASPPPKPKDPPLSKKQIAEFEKAQVILKQGEFERAVSASERDSAKTSSTKVSTPPAPVPTQATAKSNVGGGPGNGTYLQPTPFNDPTKKR